MKKEIVVSALLLLSVIAGSVYYFTRYSNGGVDTRIAKALPAETLMAIGLNACNNASLENELLLTIINDSIFSELENELKLWQIGDDSTKNCYWYKNGIAALARVNHQKLGWLFAFDNVDLDALKRNLPEIISIETEGLNGTFSKASKTFNYKFENGILLVSSHNVVLDGSYESLMSHKTSFLAERWEKSENDVLINYDLLTWLLPNVFAEKGNELNEILSPFKGVGTYKMVKSPKDLNLFGSVASSQTESVFNESFYGKPNVITSLEILPEKTSFFWSEVSFNFEAQLRSKQLNEKTAANIDSFESAHGIQLIDDVCNSLYGEYAVGALNAYSYELNNSLFTLLKVKDEQVLKQALNHLDTTNGLLSIGDSLALGQLINGDFLNHIIGGASPKFKSPFYIFMNGYVVFSDNRSIISAILRNYENGAVLKNSLEYEQVAEWTNDQCNLVFYASPKLCYTLPNGILTEKAQEFYQNNISQVEKIDHFVYQLVRSDKGFFNHIYVKSGESQVAESNVLFVKELESKISAGPFLVTNYHTKEKEIMVADEKGMLHQINKTNQTVWTYTVNGKINSRPLELDVFNNNKLQYLIPTTTDLYLLDRKGRDVGSFPITLPTKASSSATVYDLDNEKDYRIYIPCYKSRIYGYNAKGIPLNAWAPMNLSSNAIGNMQYFGKSGKRYFFTATAKGTIHIWFEHGKEAIEPLKTDANFASNFTLMFGKELEECKLLAIDSAGKYVIAKLDGTVSRRKLPAGFETPKGFWWQYDAKGGKELVLWDKNQMAVLDQNLNEKLKISTAQLIESVQVLKMPSGSEIFAVQTLGNALFLYSFKGELLRFQPFEANANQAAISDIDNDGSPDLVVGLDNKVIVYKNIK